MTRRTFARGGFPRRRARGPNEGGGRPARGPHAGGEASARGPLRQRRRWPAALAALACGLALFFPAPASAHITGVFLYFLKDVQGQAGQSSADILKAQLAETDERIRALEPEVRAARSRYEALEGPARQKALFYSQYAGEAFAAAVFDNRGPIDALANLEMLRGAVARDLGQLRETGRALAALEAKQRELTGYRDLLRAFTEAESRHDAALRDKSEQDQELALYDISESWEEIRVGPLKDYFQWAEGRLAGRPGLAQAASPAGNGRWRLDEDRLNGLLGGSRAVKGVSGLHVFLRADHVYVVGHFTVPLGTRQVILVGQFARAGASAARYRVEYALVDGFLVDPNDPQMKEVVADDTMLRVDARDLDPGARLLQFEQDNGALWLFARR